MTEDDVDRINLNWIAEVLALPVSDNVKRHAILCAVLLGPVTKKQFRRAFRTAAQAGLSIWTPNGYTNP